LPAFRAFQRLYNEDRPHQGLGDTVPADRRQPSPRRWDGALCEPDYPADCEARRVRLTCEIKWRGGLVYIHCALAGESVGLAETADG
jgi:hypothetical protein